MHRCRTICPPFGQAARAFAHPSRGADPLDALLLLESQRGATAARIVGASDRTALTLAIKAGLLASDTPKAPVRLGLPAKVHETYFPQLFPTHQITGTI
mgnify:CR=1 FL=1